MNKIFIINNATVCDFSVAENAMEAETVLGVNASRMKEIRFDKKALYLLSEIDEMMQENGFTSLTPSAKIEEWEEYKKEMKAKEVIYTFKNEKDVFILFKPIADNRVKIVDVCDLETRQKILKSQPKLKYTRMLMRGIGICTILGLIISIFS